MSELPIQTCKKRLTVLWFSIAAILFTLMLILSPKFGSKLDEAWSWFLPTILPTLSLIIGVFVAELTTPQSTQKVSKFFFSLTFSISLFYLMCILSVFTIYLLGLTDKSLLDFMKQFNIILGALQGLTAATLGAFFVQKS